MCSLFGMIDYGQSLSGKKKSRMLSALAKECEERGTDATGIAYNHNGTLRIYKRPLPARKMNFKIPDDASVIMGHTRLTTQGSARKAANNHPFFGSVSEQTFALAHNGVLYNDVLLRRTLDLPKTKIETDSYVAVQLIEAEGSLTFESLKTMAELVMGSFCFTVLNDSDEMYLIKGNNPLCLYHFPRLKLFLYASTETILRRAISRMKESLGVPKKVDLGCGDILKIDAAGNLTWDIFSAEHLLFGWGRQHWTSTEYTPASTRKGFEEAYIDDLKTAARYCGYDSSLVDTWLKSGFTVEEIEEFLYCGEI